MEYNAEKHRYQDMEKALLDRKPPTNPIFPTTEILPTFARTKIARHETKKHARGYRTDSEMYAHIRAWEASGQSQK